ncbi:unnamed protein product [Gongylonema pulchrum]|uniref:Glycine rich superfamily member n=1 Tax=Gongylonema pulchrum TaxID=637853 RepID=A0A183DQS2_9BILA|nr:unnamed protein product [Gongylonema pulchrum]
MLQQGDFVTQWSSSGLVQGNYDYQPSMGGRPGRGRAGFGPPVGGGFNRSDAGHGRGRGGAGDFGGGRGRLNYSGRYSYDRRFVFTKQLNGPASMPSA